jgi:indolepyruvate ferredoxin oxidoreductase beta subunit
MTDQSVTSVVLAGVGGQGILLGSEIIAESALLSGYEVKTNEVHGMAQRGGSVIAQIRFGKEVFGPLVPEGTATVLASLEKIEALRYHRYLAPDGVAVVSTQEIVPVTVSSGKATYPQDADKRLERLFPRLLCVDAIAVANRLGSPRSANAVILGAISNYLKLENDIWEAALRRRVKPQFLEVNLQAFAEGRKLAEAGPTE